MTGTIKSKIEFLGSRYEAFKVRSVQVVREDFDNEVDAPKKLKK